MPSQHGSSPPLLKATSSLPVDERARDRFKARISRDWCTQHSVLGGYLTALLLSAARKFIDAKGGDVAKYPDPIHVFIQFLRMVAPGQVSISCKLLRATSRLCVVKVELDLEPQPAKGQAQEHGWPQSQPNLPSRAGTSQQSQSPSCVAIATFARLDREEGLTQASTPPTLYSPPNRETECVIIDDPLVDAIPVTRKLHWVAPRSKDGLWGHRLGGHEREVWLSFRDGEKISDLLHLALLADMPLQPPATHAAGFYARHAVSTLCQSVEFKKRPGPNTEWVLVRSNSLRIVDGRYDVSVQIMDEDGDILALSNHVVIISDLDRKARM